MRTNFIKTEVQNKDVETLRKFFDDTYSNVIVGVNENDDIIVKGNVLIWNDKYKGFPVKFHKLIGELHWSTNPCLTARTDLQTLENFPDIIEGSCHINGNRNLKSLKGCPKHVKGVFDCSNCGELTILDSCPKTAKILVIANTNISDIQNILDSDIGSITLYNTPVENNEEVISQIETIMTINK